MTRRPATGSHHHSEAVIQAVTMGLSETVAQALERVGEPGLDPVSVAGELDTWRRACGLPRSDLTRPHNDWTEFIGPQARSVLEAAIQVLGHSESAPLRREVARLDAELETKTFNNPRADPTLPWWTRRWSH